MGYIKIQKGDSSDNFTSRFDLISADGIGDIKWSNGTDIIISYLSGKRVDLSAGGDNDWKSDGTDLYKVQDAVDVMNGASGVAPMTQLSVPLVSATMKPVVPAT
jgi:hypothetical protein